LKDLVDVESITGNEDDYGDALAALLGDLGFACERQEVAPGRHNLLARTGTPELVFCTHLDTVPPFFGPSEDAEFVHGRGACDAKGPALAMIEAARALLAQGCDRIGFLFTVGEEIDSAGARRANEALAEPWRPRFTIVGEPTENRFVRAHKGIFKGRLVAAGVAGHSSQDVGPSAVHELVGALHGLLAQDWGAHPVLGPGTLNVGLIEGGLAPNVVADRAAASLLLRAVEDPVTTEARIRSHLGPHVELHGVSENYGPSEFHVPAGCEPITVAFATDAPHLGRWGTPVLYGPGRILDAHTDHERVSKRSLEEAARRYASVARELLAASAVGGAR
ncbi:MAG TPA: M20/M25/M40 family metallo-hydrolase, partial [Planctomycetota bacterium]|nr:M20/M25/M40 family metallo-hydrolase [Planctomycetota bacterium]